jgi:hypothetical protein
VRRTRPPTISRRHFQRAWAVRILWDGGGDK